MSHNVLHILQDPIVGNGERKETFWEPIATHYNQNRPMGRGEHLVRSLETKWGSIKYNILKFSKVFKQASACLEFGSSPYDLLQNTLELYKAKHPKQHCFVFIHCWLIFKEIPRWMETRRESRHRASVKSSEMDVMRRIVAPAVDL